MSAPLRAQQQAAAPARVRVRAGPDATEYLEQMRAGRLSAAALVEQQLVRLHGAQASLNACTAILAEQARAQAARPQPGPLSGLPVTVKETIGLAGMTITAGSCRMRPQPQAADAAVVRRLREAGAIIIARSNVPELAMTGETTNPRYGRTLNALDRARCAGGSTGGEGALVASGASIVGIGSDILGSIRIPAAFCGIVGFKPASGAIDKQGAWPRIDGHSAQWLAVGPLARSVRDVRLLYDVLAHTPLAPPAPLHGLRLLTPTHFPFAVEQACVQSALDAAIAALAGAGMAPQDCRFDDVADLFVRAADMILHDCEPGWYAALGSGAAGRFSAWQEMWRQLSGRPTIDPGMFRWLLHGRTLGMLTKPGSAAGAARLAARFGRARDHYRAVLGSDGILVLPTLGMLAPAHGLMNRRSLRPGLNRLMTPVTFCNYCDLPAIAVPAWRHADPRSGLPPSVMLACAPGAEGRLLDAAAALERALDAGAGHPAR